MDTKMAVEIALEPKMSLREWSRSRRVPLSTAHKAVRSGRITRDADGRLDPVRADREWAQNTRPRIDGRIPITPGEPKPSATQEDDIVLDVLLADMQQPVDWRGEVGDDLVSLRVARAVDAQAHLMKRAALDRMIDRLAPILAVVSTAEDIRAVLAQGLEQAEDEFAEMWRKSWA